MQSKTPKDNGPQRQSPSHGWGTICPYCQAVINGAAIDRRSSVRRCKDRKACSVRRIATTRSRAPA